MIQRKIIFLINPISGTQNKENLIGKIESFAKKYRVIHEILYTSPVGDYTMLNHKIASENITDVIICGGDGTVNQIVSALYNCNVNFGIIPHGSGNGMAFAARIPKNVNRALSIVFEGRAQYVDAFSVNGRFGCMLTGLGFDAAVAQQFLHKKREGYLLTSGFPYKIIFIRNFTLLT
jgi:diacylglycerol kinase family enzyme